MEGLDAVDAMLTKETLPALNQGKYFASKITKQPPELIMIMDL